MLKSTFFGPQNAKPIRQCEILMIIDVERRRVSDSNVVGYPFIPIGHKSEIRSFEAGDKTHVVGGALGRGNERGSQTEEISGGGEGALYKKRKSPFE
ncbi:hypothetical protein AVEN_80106-1 [Araneus ventricosus]|uniref:Uncharacterized protein n=1 Tax=Araneus ventricosus TaxID=182803 RepID=A0A4Y2A7F9_ARAVE|nr:hypothetical protein AVEN_80106-1 [Araneus ventricosus]